MNKYFVLLSLSLVLILSFCCSGSVIDPYGALIRSDTTQQNIYLCFTGHDYYEGFDHVLEVLEQQNTLASFFLTGDFIRNHSNLVKTIAEDGHYVGAHSDRHLLYCDWLNRDSLLFPPDSIRMDIVDNLLELEKLGIKAGYFMPPYEWYNKKIVEIASGLNQLTVNFTPGTRSNADYTTPDLSNYVSSIDILDSIYEYEKTEGMNGFHLLIHPGTNPLRTDKFYLYLNELIVDLKKRDYTFQRF